MGKKRGSTLSYIKDKVQRNVAFCKRKRGFLKKAIELSQLCGQKIFIVVYDEQRKRLVQFSSNDDFEIKSAYNALNLIRQKDYCHNYEKFTNKDYKNLEETDFRSLRYKKEEAYTNNNNEIAEFELSNISASEVQSVSSVCSKDRKLSKVEEWKTPSGEIESNQKEGIKGVRQPYNQMQAHRATTPALPQKRGLAAI